MSNHLHPESTPNREFENRTTNMDTMLKFAFGDPVIVSRTVYKFKHPIVTKKKIEFGIVLVSGTRNNGAVLCWLPGRKRNFVAWRLNVRLINLGTPISMSYQEGVELQPEFKKGIWLLKSRGNAESMMQNLIDDLQISSKHDDVEESLEISSKLYSTLDVENDEEIEQIEEGPKWKN